ncbi:CRISPR system precrRNA processing endoribonuclease RAMP protein Cas6 [Deinococcus sp. Arct2-2]|uniref:CRISPR system precrRNA processing endoribonuclease RAMP protein Cas6 n=1 Tax=Deinococcus sp. Arct2-2 TaxID=2568653 RepID=UPI0010A4E726|nr:CRISPR system precrRNA processing endoribonuclease RAMP protein Cas6 [Deinococcus sp. Arct2-2]THF70971.1 CRISPR system precrRNA processing endoribonuclease RAMP protein Cas6 [Deinococcus sp. Arct2-2]
MPALLEVTLHTPHARPTGLLGVPLHGLIFSALEAVSPALSAQIHAAQVKPFRIAQSWWEEGEGLHRVTFQLGVLDDSLIDPMLAALAEGTEHGDPEATLRGVVVDLQVLAQESYEALYSRHAQSVTGRQLSLRFLTPTTFRVTDLELPFPTPKTVFAGLQVRWEHFCDLHFGPDLNDWVSRAVRVQDFRLRSRTVYFKGMRGNAMSACVGDVDYSITRPGDAEPTFVRLLADYANYAGVGYKTTFGLGHVEAAGWRDSALEATGDAVGAVGIGEQDVSV